MSTRTNGTLYLTGKNTLLGDFVDAAWLAIPSIADSYSYLAKVKQGGTNGWLRPQRNRGVTRVSDLEPTANKVPKVTFLPQPWSVEKFSIGIRPRGCGIIVIQYTVRISPFRDA